MSHTADGLIEKLRAGFARARAKLRRQAAAAPVSPDRVTSSAPTPPVHPPQTTASPSAGAGGGTGGGTHGGGGTPGPGGTSPPATAQPVQPPGSGAPGPTVGDAPETGKPREKVGERSGGVADARAATRPGEVIENPESLRAGGKLATPSELEGVGRHVRENPGQWSEGPLNRGTYKGTPGEEGGGLKWMELKNGEPTGSQVRYNPGTPRHYDGKPYWTVIRNDPATGRAVRLDVTEDGVFPR